MQPVPVSGVPPDVPSRCFPRAVLALAAAHARPAVGGRAAGGFRLQRFELAFELLLPVEHALQLVGHLGGGGAEAGVVDRKSVV